MDSRWSLNSSKCDSDVSSNSADDVPKSASRRGRDQYSAGEPDTGEAQTSPFVSPSRGKSARDSGNASCHDTSSSPTPTVEARSLLKTSRLIVQVPLRQQSQSRHVAKTDQRGVTVPQQRLTGVVTRPELRRDALKTAKIGYEADDVHQRPTKTQAKPVRRQRRSSGEAKRGGSSSSPQVSALLAQHGDHLRRAKSFSIGFHMSPEQMQAAVVTADVEKPRARRSLPRPPAGDDDDDARRKSTDMLLRDKTLSRPDIDETSECESEILRYTNGVSDFVCPDWEHQTPTARSETPDSGNVEKTDISGTLAHSSTPERESHSSKSTTSAAGVWQENESQSAFTKVATVQGEGRPGAAISSPRPYLPRNVGQHLGSANLRTSAVSGRSAASDDDESASRRRKPLAHRSSFHELPLNGAAPPHQSSPQCALYRVADDPKPDLRQLARYGVLLPEGWTGKTGKGDASDIFARSMEPSQLEEGCRRPSEFSRALGRRLLRPAPVRPTVSPPLHALLASCSLVRATIQFADGRHFGLNLADSVFTDVEHPDERWPVCCVLDVRLPPTAADGVLVDDILLEINGQRVTSSESASQQLACLTCAELVLGRRTTCDPREKQLQKLIFKYERLRGELERKDDRLAELELELRTLTVQSAATMRKSDVVLRSHGNVAAANELSSHRARPPLVTSRGGRGGDEYKRRSYDIGGLDYRDYRLHGRHADDHAPSALERGGAYDSELSSASSSLNETSAPTARRSNGERATQQGANSMAEGRRHISEV